MTPLDLDDPCHELYLCDTSLDCDSHVEAEFYVSRVQPSRLELCCHCACVLDSPIVMNTHLKAPAGPYSVVLPICNACIDSGCPMIVRLARNSKAKQARLEHQHGREAVAPGDATGNATTTIGSTTASGTTFVVAIATASPSATTTTTTPSVNPEVTEAEPHQLPNTVKRKKRTANTRYVKIVHLLCTLMFQKCRIDITLVLTCIG